MSEENNITIENKNEPQKKSKSLIKKIIDGVLIVFIAFFAIIEITSLVSRINNYDVPNIFGNQILLVLTDSMQEYEVPTDEETPSGTPAYPIDTGISYPVGTGIISQKIDPSLIAVGDDITFYDINGTELVTTHRVVEIQTASDGSLTFLCRGINILNSSSGTAAGNKSQYNTVPEDYVLGKVVFSSAALGGFIQVTQNQTVMLFVILIPLGILLIWSLIDVFKAARMSDKEAELVSQGKSKEEIEAQMKEELKKEYMEQLKKELSDEIKKEGDKKEDE